jgi:hypothetical protein
MPVAGKVHAVGGHISTEHAARSAHGTNGRGQTARHGGLCGVSRTAFHSAANSVPDAIQTSLGKRLSSGARSRSTALPHVAGFPAALACSVSRSIRGFGYTGPIGIVAAPRRLLKLHERVAPRPVVLGASLTLGPKNVNHPTFFPPAKFFLGLCAPGVVTRSPPSNFYPVSKVLEPKTLSPMELRLPQTTLTSVVKTQH